MGNILVRDLPEPVHAELQRRAARKGQSLQQFLTAALTELAQTPELDELLDRIEKERSGGRVGLGQSVDDLTELRNAR